VPIWGYPAKLYVAEKAKLGEWQVVFLDDSDAADALGYHDLTKDGQPVSKVFVKSTLGAGQKVSTTASHELLEMMIDPGAQMWAQSDNGVFYAYEMCDAVEDEEYEIDGVAVSDFLYPSFFESWHKPRSTSFDHLGRVSRPFQTLQNGYQIVSNGKAVREVFGSRPKANHFHDVEVRTMHRSEYRKQMMLRRAGAFPVANTQLETADAHAAALRHAGGLMTALAALTGARRGSDGLVDPLPGGDPFDL
jgi:hypothetical protein